MTLAKKLTQDDVTATGATGLCEGTGLRTPCGERKVEYIRTGDLVVTRDNGLQAVRLIWTKTVSEAEVTADPSLAPVVLEPRAIGPMMPQRLLRVGGAHRLLVPGWRLQDDEDHVNCLIPARDVDGVSLGSDAPAAEVTYYNIVFDEPQVFCASGMPVESFNPNEDTLGAAPKEVQDDIRSLFPDLGKDPEDVPEPRYKRRKRASYTPTFA